MTDFLKVNDVAKLLNCSVRTVNSMRTNAGLPCLKMGRLVRFSQEQVLAWVAEKQKADRGVRSLSPEKQAEYKSNQNEKEA